MRLTTTRQLPAFRAGASHVTHIFNGMNDCLHRSPGIAGAAADLGIPVELICDGLHVHPAVVRGVFRVFGKKNLPDIGFASLRRNA